MTAGAPIRLIAPEVTNEISALAQTGALEWEPHLYANGDLHDAFLVVSIADAETNARVLADAEGQHTFCNALDDVRIAVAMHLRSCDTVSFRSPFPRQAIVRRSRNVCEENPKSS